MLTFEEFELAILNLGVMPLDRGKGHWQVKTTKCVINYYPWSSSKTIYVNAIPNITKAVRALNAEIADVTKLVQELQEKENNYAKSTPSNNDAKKHSDSVRPDAGTV